MTTETQIEEIAGTKKFVVRGGKVVSKVDCPDGYKWDRSAKKCVRITATEKIAMKKASKKAVRTRRQHAGKNRISAAKSRRKSLRVRKSRSVSKKAVKKV